MSDQIKLNAIRLQAICGALPEEQIRKQPFEINLEIKADLDKACKSDDLDDTIDYGPICEAINDLALNEKFTLIEHFALRILEVVFKCDSRVDTATVSLKKLNVPVEIAIGSAEVIITRTNPAR